MAFARRNGIGWSESVNTFKREADVGEFDVRTRAELYQELIVRRDDELDRVFVLVHLLRFPSVLHVSGWIHGRDAARDAYLRMHGGRPAAWFVPHSAMAEFVEPSRRFDDAGLEVLPEFTGKHHGEAAPMWRALMKERRRSTTN